MTYFKKMLSTSPEVSSARFLSVVTVLTILYTWMFVSLWTKIVQDIPTGVVALATAVVVGSVGNKAFEKDKQAGSTKTETSTTTVVE